MPPSPLLVTPSFFSTSSFFHSCSFPRSLSSYFPIPSHQYSSSPSLTRPSSPFFPIPPAEARKSLLAGRERRFPGQSTTLISISGLQWPRSPLPLQGFERSQRGLLLCVDYGEGRRARRIRRGKRTKGRGKMARYGVKGKPPATRLYNN